MESPSACLWAPEEAAIQKFEKIAPILLFHVLFLFHCFMTMPLNVCCKGFFPSLRTSHIFSKSFFFFLTYFATDSLESLDLV